MHVVLGQVLVVHRKEQKDEPNLAYFGTKHHVTLHQPCTSWLLGGFQMRRRGAMLASPYSSPCTLFFFLPTLNKEPSTP